MTSFSVSHGGDLRRLAMQARCAPDEIVDFSASINPLGPPDWVPALISANTAAIVSYPDPESTALRVAAARRFAAELSEIVAGNGSAELLQILPRALGVKRAVIPVPSYGDYRTAAESAGLPSQMLPSSADQEFRLDLGVLESALRGDELVVIGQPNNPTGQHCGVQQLRSLALRWPSTMFVVDEAFADFLEDSDSLAFQRPANVIVVRSLTKFWAVPGLRLGLALAAPEVALRLRRMLQPWPVNSLAQLVGAAALSDTSDYAARTRALVERERARLVAELGAIGGLTVFPGQANFLLVRIEDAKLDGGELFGRLLRDRIAVRPCDGFEGLGPRYFRVAVRTADDNERLCRSLRSARGLRTPAVVRKTPAIMFQGTSSGAGKSLLAAAMCRLLLEDGYRVAPFKSQNMSLNSYVTRDGGEIGRAQALQAHACRLEPDTRMNPILLKPCTDTGAQVIVCGRAVGSMGVDEYIGYKPTAFARALESYDSLAAEHDVMVLEGAGSPAEVNLKRHDIANMQMARHAAARVVIAGDIDRGGVFASFAGTMHALGDWERRMVSGFVVNRFRGREELLADALAWTERVTGRPVLGVVPFLSDLNLPEEDSVGLKRSACGEHQRPGREDGQVLDCAVIELPHMSNFTDFDALRVEPGVCLRFVRRPDELARPDLLVLPGSKSVIADLAALRAAGWDTAIGRLAAERQTTIVGICGGFQMLGRHISDPHGVESAAGSVSGLGLLPVATVLEREKTLRRSEAVHVESGLKVLGYEIHHGRTDARAAKVCWRRDDGECIGASSDDARVWGTYLHGVFDGDAFRHLFLDGLTARRCGAAQGDLPDVQSAPRIRYDVETSVRRLADVVRQRLDLGRLYREIGLR